MNQVIKFPQRQHSEFRRLVFKTVREAARAQQLSIEEYIDRIYHAGENPGLFNSLDGLRTVYKRFTYLIELALKSDKSAEELSRANKAYLCFRIYLHSLCLERQSMPESEAELYLQDALQEYFLAQDKVLDVQEENRIMRYLKRLRNTAESLPD